MAKRWMVSVEDDQYEWISETINETKLKGSVIIRAAIERARQDKAFKKELSNEHLKMQLQKLNDEEAAIQERRQALTRQLKGGVSKGDNVLV